MGDRREGEANGPPPYFACICVYRRSSADKKTEKNKRNLMQAIEYIKSVPRWLIVRSGGRKFPFLYTGRLAPVRLTQRPPPELPGPDWVRVQPLLSGICGSDLATVTCQGSPYFSGITSTPFVLGHEVVGVVSETGADADGLDVGQRVVLQPALGCAVRGIDPPCVYCARGQLALCRNVARGGISAGIQTGFCRDTGGAWSEEFVAHRSQLYRVPEAMPDEIAVLTEPFACCLHAVLHAGMAPRQPTDRAFVLGCGTVGLMIIAGLRALNFAGQIIAAARYPHQAEHARHLGADVILPATRGRRRRYQAWAETLDAACHDAELGKPVVIGGADVVFDCVASSESIDDALRFTAAGGRMVLVGMPGIPRGVDWTSMWYQEVQIIASYAYGREDVDGREVSTFELALEFLNGKWGEKLRPLVGKAYMLKDYREAIQAALQTGRSRAVKTVFRIGGRGE